MYMHHVCMFVYKYFSTTYIAYKQTKEYEEIVEGKTTCRLSRKSACQY